MYHPNQYFTEFSSNKSCGLQAIAPDWHNSISFIVFFTYIYPLLHEFTNNIILYYRDIILTPATDQQLSMDRGPQYHLSTTYPISSPCMISDFQWLCFLFFLFQKNTNFQISAESLQISAFFRKSRILEESWQIQPDHWICARDFISQYNSIVGLLCHIIV